MAAASGSKTLRSVLNEFTSDAGKEEYSITHLEDASTNYDIPKISTDQIYKETMLCRPSFLNDYKVKTLEERFLLGTKQKDIYLLSRDVIRKHRSKYNFLHIGSLQVSFTPLTLTKYSNATILICLRNTKYPNFKDSILAAFESSVYHGHDEGIRFNWFPNFSSPLSDLASFNGLGITIEPHGFDLAKGYENSQMLEITYTMCYKLMKNSLEPKTLFESRVLEVNLEKTNVIVPKSIN